MSPNPPSTSPRQSGALLIEAMVGILLFTIAVLGMVGLQSNLMRETQQSRFRIDAAYLANGLISRMWGDVVASHAGYGYAAGDCAAPPVALANWCAAATNLLPAVQADIAVTPGNSVVTPPIPTTATITLSWGIVGENYRHQYQTVALIGP